MDKSERKIKFRIMFITVFVLICMFIEVVYILWIQVVKGADYRNQAYSQQTRERTISPKRGTIYDRNMKALAVSASTETVSITPTVVRDYNFTDVVADGLSRILEMDREEIIQKINKNTANEVIKKRIDRSKGDEIRVWRQENKVSGVYIDEDSKRYYPNGNLASQILGFTGTDNQGLYGLEAVYDKYLKGVPGKIMVEADRDNQRIPFANETMINSQNGYNLILTIDETIQYLADKALEEAILEYDVRNGACAIVMDPRNGEILAMSSKQDFDPNNPFARPSDIPEEVWDAYTVTEKSNLLNSKYWRNKAISDTYEPGSTFKAFTTAAGLEEALINPESEVVCAPISVAGHTISCWSSTAHGHQDFRHGVYNSCNPVFVKVSQSLGVSKFYEYIRAFGFFDKTGINLLGEGSSIFHTKPQEIDMAVASFGQRFNITPLQLITAYCAIANGGTLVKPQIVKAMVDDENNVIKKYDPEYVRNVISKDTSDTLRSILEGVVSEGSGGNAYIKGYKVAGKTGTSQTLEENHYIASFSAFAPADNPVINVLVILDNPSGGVYYGSQTAAPVAGKLVENILSYMEVERNYTEADLKDLEQENKVPDISGKTLEVAKRMIQQSGFVPVVSGDNDNTLIVKDQMPEAGALLTNKSTVVIYTNENHAEDLITVPDLTNKTTREATDTLKNIGLNIKLEGRGVAIKQSVLPNEKVKRGSIITVEFRILNGD